MAVDSESLQSMGDLLRTGGGYADNALILVDFNLSDFPTGQICGGGNGADDVVWRDSVPAANVDDELAIESAASAAPLKLDVLKGKLFPVEGDLQSGRCNHLKVAAGLQHLADHVLIILGYALRDGVQELLALVLAEFDVDEPTAAADLDALLEQFRQMELLEE